MKKITWIVLLACSLGFGQNKRKLVWSDEFNGKTLDAKSWNFETGNGCPNNCGWGNNERQIYTDHNHQLVDGKLVITIEHKDGQYTSTRITTAGKHEFQYGRIEARLKLPTGQGIWPAFWMLGANIGQVGWPQCGEIDIMEYVGRDPHQIYTTLHTQDSHGNSVNSKKTEFPKIEDGFHVYAAEWDADQIAFYVDDQLVYTFRPTNKTPEIWPFNKPQFLLINAAVGGNFGGPEVNDQIFPQQYLIDYVRVYQ